MFPALIVRAIIKAAPWDGGPIMEAQQTGCLARRHSRDFPGLHRLWRELGTNYVKPNSLPKWLFADVDHAKRVPTQHFQLQRQEAHGSCTVVMQDFIEVGVLTAV